MIDLSYAWVLDSLSLPLIALAVGVTALVQIYSVAYLRGDPRFRSYAVLVTLFGLAMVVVVATDDLLVLLIGWEVMGACSYLLIGHHWEQRAAREGAIKAFLMTRFGDLGLLIGIIVIGESYGSYQISEVLDTAATAPQLPTAIGLLLVLAVVGKSSQFPLHTWLPDAMPGPTPVSALIHAATMVAAGVYLLARLNPLYAGSVVVVTALALIAVITMVLAALYALTSTDLKRVLAWSTVSQLAYMFAAIAVADPRAGIDHLLSHGAFKALLFLAAGSLMHAVGSSSLSAMGGLRRDMPVTFVTATVGFAALAGLPPTAGFFSKDTIIDAGLTATDGGAVVAPVTAWIVVLAALVTVFVTAMYAARAWLAAFFGPASGGAREAPWPMCAPLVILAIATCALSLTMEAHWGLGAITALIALAGIGVSWSLWRSGHGLSAISVPDDCAGLTVVPDVWLPRGALRAARGVSRTDDVVVAGAVHRFEGLAGGASKAITRMQSGNAQTYVSLLAVSTFVVAGCLVLAR